MTTTTTSLPLSRLLALCALAVGIVVVLGGCGNPQLNCNKLCKRMESCYYEVMQRQDQLSRSTVQALKTNPSLRKRFQQNTRKTCLRTCNKNNEKSVYRRKDVKRIKRCIKHKRCARFSRCVSPVRSPG